MAFLGMRGSGQFTANELPEDWDQVILYEYPNGQTPIFAIQSMFAEQSVGSSTFNWWTETMPNYTGAVSSIYIDEALSTEYVYASHQATHGIAGATVYVKIAEALALQCVPGVTVALRDQDRPKVTVRGRIEAQKLNGSSSYVAVTLIEADDNDDDSSSYNLATVDRIIFMAPAHPWGSTAPLGLSTSPTQYTNNTQIARTTFTEAETATIQETRTGDVTDNDKIRLMYRHALGWEWTAIFGHKYSTTSSANKMPLLYTQGIVDFVLENNSANFVDFRYVTDSAYAGKTWEEAGHQFIRDYITALRRWVPENLFCVCGDGAGVGMERLAETYGHINMNVGQKDYGLEINEYRTMSGGFMFKNHPLMSQEVSTRNMMIFYVPENVKLCPLVNKGKSRKDRYETNLQIPGTDGFTEGFIGEQGWKFFHPNQFLILDGIGFDNEVAA